MGSSRFFTADKLFDNVTVIGGLAGELCYLIEGENKALLIDALTGVGSLKAYVRELTELPVQVVNTHGHVDHCGANFEYKQCMIHPDDIGLMYHHSDPVRRLEFAKSGAAMGPLPVEPVITDVIEPCAVKTYPIYDGDVIELGGVSIEAIGVPGHSRGTLVFLDRARRLIYSGDACNVNTLLFLEGSTSIEEYRESLEHLKKFESCFDVMYGGHGSGPVPKSIIDDAISLCGEIMEGRDDSVESSFLGRHCFYAKKTSQGFARVDGGLANIAYSKDMIWKSQMKPTNIR